MMARAVLVRPWPLSVVTALSVVVVVVLLLMLLAWRIAIIGVACISKGLSEVVEQIHKMQDTDHMQDTSANSEVSYHVWIRFERSEAEGKDGVMATQCKF